MRRMAGLIARSDIRFGFGDYGADSMPSGAPCERHPQQISRNSQRWLLIQPRRACRGQGRAGSIENHDDVGPVRFSRRSARR